jgi:hypothetical protein
MRDPSPTGAYRQAKLRIRDRSDERMHALATISHYDTTISEYAGH